MSGTKRQSSIELVKITAMFLIVLSHVCMILADPELMGEYVIDLRYATTDIQRLVLIIFRYCGTFGNVFFLVSSAWFLVRDGSVGINGRRVLRVMIHVFVFSVGFLIAFLLLGSGEVSRSLIIKSFLPTTLSNNWYITCYILLLCIHSYLNKLLFSLKKREMLILSSLLFSLYFVLSTVFAPFEGTLFFTSEIVVFVAVYCIIAYLKIHLAETISQPTFARAMVLLGGFGLLAQIIFMDILGLYVPGFAGSMMAFKKITNVFLLLLVVGIFLKLRKSHFYMPAVNYLSGLTIYIYISHENILIRNITRPRIWKMMIDRFGTGYLPIQALVFALALFVASLAISVLYKSLLEKIINKISDYIFERLSKSINCSLEKILALK